MPKGDKPTSFDIAYMAGVSQATVSRALRNSPLVSKETRIKVQSVARQLNYKVDKNAANLRSQQTRTLALLLFEDPTSDDSLINPFFLAMLGNITRAAARNGYDLLVSFQQLSEDWHGEYEVSSRADGMILLGYGDYVSYAEKLAHLAEANAHFIIWGPMVEDQPGHSLGCDNVQGCYDASRHLLDLGHRRIAFIGGASEHCPEFLLRYQGYSKALTEAGTPVDKELQVDADNQEISGYQAAQQLLEDGREFSAVVCASDLMAIGAIKAFKENGKQVPGDVAVVGFDDIPAASYMNPPLTTVHQDTNLAGKLLVENLIKLIEGEAVESSLLAPSLVIRESCASET